MKKVINQKRYDTDTAKCIGWDSWGTPGDLKHWSEKLYQKRTGEFFLYGEGGAMSKYAETIGQNKWSGGEKIMPLDYESAREWAEKHLGADEYEKTFQVIEDEEDDGKKKITTFSIPVSAAKKLKTMAAKSGKTQSAIVADLILGA
jgi:hypothetical protein